MIIFRRMLRSRTARALGALLMAYAVLLPVYGPMLDPSFAERLPYHKHVYPHGFVAAHVHSYQLESDAPAGKDVTGAEGGVVALPFGDDGAAAAMTAVLIGLAILVAVPGLFLPITPAVAPLRRGCVTFLDPPPPRHPALAFA